MIDKFHLEIGESGESCHLVQVSTRMSWNFIIKVFPFFSRSISTFRTFLIIIEDICFWKFGSSKSKNQTVLRVCLIGTDSENGILYSVDREFKFDWLWSSLKGRFGLFGRPSEHSVLKGWMLDRLRGDFRFNLPSQVMDPKPTLSWFLCFI